MSCINSGLPAALVKCLYLLVCLPAKKENVATEETFQEPLTKVDGRNCHHAHSLCPSSGHTFLYFSVFPSPVDTLSPAPFQVLLQLCRQPANVERLVETQELQCLIIGLTSLLDQTTPAWRHRASRVLKAVSAVATSNTVPSLQGGKRFLFIEFLFLLLVLLEHIPSVSVSQKERAGHNSE